MGILSPPPRCCGGIHWVIDNTRYREWADKAGAYEVCNCDGAHYHHRPGSIVFCRHSNATLEQLEYEWSRVA